MKTKNWLWIFPIGWMGLIFYLSHQPRLPLPGPNFPGQDKVIHAMVYFFLSFLGRLPCSSESYKTFFGIWLGCTLYGISDEFHQSLVPGRYFEIADMLADSVGAFFGVLIFMHPQAKSWKKQWEKRFFKN